MKQLQALATWNSKISPKVVTKEMPIATVINIRDEVTFTYDKSKGDVTFELEYTDRTFGTRSTYSVNGGSELPADLINKQSVIAAPLTSNNMIDLTNEPNIGTITIFINLGLRKLLRLKGGITRIATFSKYDVPSYTRLLCQTPNLISVPKSIPKHWTDINNILAGCTLLNDTNLSYWNTGNLEVISEAFYGCKELNVPLFWNVKKVRQANYFLRACAKFNQDLSKWCVPNLTASPVAFASLTPIETVSEKLPVWGTCPVEPL